MRRLALALALAAVPAASFAFEGNWRGGRGNYQQDADITKTADGTWEASLTVGTPGCSGGFDGVGKVEGDALLLRPKEPFGADDKCVMTVKRKGAGLEIEEDGCLAWHGASCEFSGKYRMAKKRRK